MKSIELKEQSHDILNIIFAILKHDSNNKIAIAWQFFWISVYIDIHRIMTLSILKPILLLLSSYPDKSDNRDLIYVPGEILPKITEKRIKKEILLSI